MIDSPVNDKSDAPVTESSITETPSPPVSTPEPEVAVNKPVETNDEPLSIPNTPCAASTPAVLIHKCDPRPFDSGLGRSDMDDGEMSQIDDDPVKQKLFDLSRNDSSYNLRPRKE